MAFHESALTPGFIRQYLFGDQRILSLQLLNRLERGEAKGNLPVYLELAAVLEDLYPKPWKWELAPEEIDRLPVSQADLRVETLLLLAAQDISLAATVNLLAQKALRDPMRQVREAAAHVLGMVVSPTPALLEFLFRCQSAEDVPSVAWAISQTLVRYASKIGENDRRAIADSFARIAMTDKIYPAPVVFALRQMGQMDPIGRAAFEQILQDQAGVYTARARAAAIHFEEHPDSVPYAFQVFPINEWTGMY